MAILVRNSKAGPRRRRRRCCCGFSRGAAQLKVLAKSIQTAGSGLCSHCILWVCLHCSKTFCGGDKEDKEDGEGPLGHALLHYAQTKHPCAVRRNNPSISWCYLCKKSRVTFTRISPPPPSLSQEEEEEEEEDSHLTGGIVRGISNKRNNCFLNAVVQNLLQTKPLRKLMYGYLSYKVSSPITLALRALFLDTTVLLTSAGVIAPDSLLYELSLVYKQFEVRHEHDSHEFLRCLLGGLQKEETYVEGIFAGEMTSTLSYECGHSQVVNETFLDLSLSIARHPGEAASIHSCLEFFTREEHLNEACHENCPKNDTTIKRGATTRILFNGIPTILIIHLKRFLKKANGVLKKINRHVEFSEELNLGPYMHPSTPTDNDKCQYRLTGVVVHSGNINQGHYFAYVRTGKVQDKKQKSSSPANWFYANDTLVRKAPLSEILSSNAYLLFYERVQT